MKKKITVNELQGLVSLMGYLSQNVEGGIKFGYAVSKTHTKAEGLMQSKVNEVSDKHRVMGKFQEYVGLRHQVESVDKNRLQEQDLKKLSEIEDKIKKLEKENTSMPAKYNEYYKAMENMLSDQVEVEIHQLDKNELPTPIKPHLITQMEKYSFIKH